MRSDVRSTPRLLAPAILALVIVLAAEFLCWILAIPKYIFPRPSLVVASLISHGPDIWAASLITFSEATLGFLIANLVAFLISFVFSFSPLAYRSGYPLFVAFQSIPLIALAPFIAIWFGTELVSKVMMAVLLCVFPATIIATNALRSTNVLYTDYLSSLAGGRMRQVFLVILPSSLPALMAALHVTAPLSVIGALVAEFAGADRGLGFMILSASYTFNVALMLACVVVATLFALTMYFFVSILDSKVRDQFGIRTY